MDDSAAALGRGARRVLLVRLRAAAVRRPGDELGWGPAHRLPGAGDRRSAARGHPRPPRPLPTSTSLFGVFWLCAYIVAPPLLAYGIFLERRAGPGAEAGRPAARGLARGHRGRGRRDARRGRRDAAGARHRDRPLALDADAAGLARPRRVHARGRAGGADGGAREPAGAVHAAPRSPTRRLERCSCWRWPCTSRTSGRRARQRALPRLPGGDSRHRASTARSRPGPCPGRSRRRRGPRGHPRIVHTCAYRASTSALEPRPVAVRWMKTATLSPSLARLDDLLLEALPLGQELLEEGSDRVAAEMDVGLGQRRRSRATRRLPPAPPSRTRCHRG